MATHSSIVAWEIPWAEEPGGLQSMGSQRVIPYNEMDIFFWVLVLKHLVGLHRTVQLQLLQHYWSETWITVILNGLPWKMKEIILSFLRLHPSTAYQTFVDQEGYSISSNRFLDTVVDIMVICIKFGHSSPFQSLISKVSMFTRLISCLTTSNLP